MSQSVHSFKFEKNNDLQSSCSPLFTIFNIPFLLPPMDLQEERGTDDEDVEMESPTTTNVSSSTASLTSSPSSSSSSSSYSPSNASPIRVLPPPPITLDMSPDEVATNLIQHHFSHPDEAAQLAKKKELIAYIRAEVDRKTVDVPKSERQSNLGLQIATGLIDRLPVLVTISLTGVNGNVADGSTYSNSQYINQTYGRADAGRPGFDVHISLLTKLGIKRPLTREEYFAEKLQLTSKYVEQCEANGETVNPRKMPKYIQIGDGDRTRDLHTFFSKVFAGQYDNDDEFLKILPQLEAILDTTIAKSLPFEELCNVIATTYDNLECKDLSILLAKVPDIYKRGFGVSVTSTDPHYLALTDSTGAIKINDKVNGWLGMMSPIPMNCINDDDRNVLHSISCILFHELCKVEVAGTNRISGAELDQPIAESISKITNFVKRFEHIPHGRRHARFMCATGGERHHEIQVTARDQDSVTYRTFLVDIGYASSAAHAMAKLKKRTNKGRLMLAARVYWDSDDWRIELGCATSMVQNEAGWKREGRRTFQYSKEAQIPLEAVVPAFHVDVLNRMEKANQMALKAPGGFLDAAKCPRPFASEDKRPEDVPPPKKNSRKTKTAAATSDTASGRKEIDGALREVQESSDISAESKNVLGGVPEMLDRLSILEQQHKDDTAKPPTKVLSLQAITNLGRGNGSANPLAASSNTTHSVVAAHAPAVGTSSTSSKNVAPGAVATRRRSEPTQPLVVSQDVENKILRKKIEDLEGRLQLKELATDESLEEEKDRHEKTKTTLSGLMNSQKKLQQERRILTPQQRVDIDLQASQLADFVAKERAWVEEKSQLERQLKTVRSLQDTAETERDEARREKLELDDKLRLLRSAAASAGPLNQPRTNGRSRFVQDQASFEVDKGHKSLPPNCQKHYSAGEGRHYYQYSDGKRIQFSQWYYPTASEVADPAMAMERAKQNTSEDTRKRQRND